jgi:glycosyltransferase involved in cell wall biosynthesis
VRILHLAQRLSARGGADWHLLGVLEALSPNHEVHLAVGHADGSARAPCPWSLVPGLGARIRAPVKLDDLVRAFAPEVVHLHNLVNPEVLEWAATVPAVMTLQDHRAFCPGRGKWTLAGSPCTTPMAAEVCRACFEDEAYFQEIHRLTEERLRALRRLRLIVLSSYMKRELEAIGVPPERIEIIPPFVHGLDPEAAPDGSPCALFVGRLVAAKGVHEALEAWRQSRLDLPLLFAGTGPMRQRLERAGATVLGWVPHERLSALYRRARVVLLPSRWQEPFGIAGLEALTLGTPVAAWRSGGVPEWHPGPGLVPWGDVSGLAVAAQELCGREACAPPGFERETLMARLLALYSSICIVRRTAR